jgi:hypothetical protein
MCRDMVLLAPPGLCKKPHTSGRLLSLRSLMGSFDGV